MTNSARQVIAASCGGFFVVLVFCGVGLREDPDEPPFQPVRPMQTRAANPAVHAGAIGNQAPATGAGKDAPARGESGELPAIPAFRQWAAARVAAGFAQADEIEGMELAKARATAMKALIQQDPAAALRQALPADLRASLPAQIAAAIEQPVQTTGTCSIRMMCNHSPDAPHRQCEATPVLLEVVESWNAHYGALQWQSHVGREVRFEGLAVEGELAVRSMAPVSNDEKH